VGLDVADVNTRVVDDDVEILAGKVKTGRKIKVDRYRPELLPECFSDSSLFAVLKPDARARGGESGNQRLTD